MDDSQRNLIVNYLPNSLTPEAFKELFTQFGEIESCRIIYNKVTGQSQGYGFIKFGTDEAAGKAILHMNGHMVDNKTLKVSLAQKIASPGLQQANLYVANLPKHYTKTELEQLFLPYGALLETKILLDPTTGQSKGVGFVRFAAREHAQVAIEYLHNQIPLGADGPITVRFSNEQTKGKAVTGAAAVRGQFRYNPMGAAPAAAAYGDLTSHLVPAAYPMYQQAGMPQAFGMYQAAVPAAVAAPSLAYCLFVYNIPADADEGLLYRLFGPFGALSDVKVMREAGTNRCKGFGFVHYLKLEDAQHAIMSMNGYQLGDKLLQVSFKKQK